jgi:hypothetical protein
MKSLAKFLKLAGRDKLLFLEALFVLAAVRIALNVSTYRAVERHIAAPARSIKQGVGPGRVAWAVRNMAPLVPGATCLTQALTAQHLMARTGRASKIRIGVAKDEAGAITAHAWLMFEDRVIIGGMDHDLARYAAIADLAPGSS